MATYYVDNLNGDDSNTGLTSASPWKTVAKVNGFSFAAGDNILFVEDGEWWETLKPSVGGAEDNELVFGQYSWGVGSADPIIHADHAYRYNHRSIEEYDASGLGHNPTSGISQNDDMELGSGTSVDFWSLTTSGTGTATADTTEAHSGARSVKLFDGTGFGRIGATFHFTREQRYEVSFWAKSDGTGTATARFFQASNGLANTKTGDTYQTWTGTADIADLAVAATDTDWTEKKIQLLVDASDHPVTFQITTGTANQSVWIDDIRVRPMWTNFSGDTWMTAHQNAQIGSIFMCAFDGVASIPAADAASVDASNRWVNVKVGTINDHILYVNSPNGSPASSSENIDVATTTNSRAFDGNDKTYIICDGLDFRHGYAVAGNFGANTTIRNGALRVGVYAALIDANNFTLEDSVVEYGDWIVNIGASDGVTIRRNTIRHAKKFAVSVTGGEGGCLAPSVVTGGDCTNLLVESNTFHDAAAYGIAEFGQDASNRIEDAIYRYNTIYDCWFAMWTQALANGVSNSKFYYNLAHSPKSSGDAVGGGSIATSCGYLHYRAGNTVQFYNNTLVGFATGIRGWNGVLSLDAQNNLVIDSIDHHVRTTDPGWTIATLGTNLYHSSGSPIWQLAGTNYSTLAAWQAAVEPTAVGGDPLFVNPGANNYKPRRGSPAINAGASLGLTQDFNGGPIIGTPDIGAHEYNPTTDPLYWRRPEFFKRRRRRRRFR